MSGQTFRICTLSNRPEQYAAMKASFVAAGFDERRCRYALFDNSEANAHDPYRTISAVLESATEPYVIFCHQDLLADRGDGFDALVAALDRLTEADPAWAVAGNAGCTEDLTTVVKINDPHDAPNHAPLPRRVYSLDENFLVVRTAAGLRCSDDLSGFHLYATDLCLQAARRGLSCHVIDFYLTHLSGGSPEGEDFQRHRVAFIQKWDPFFTLCLIHTPCSYLYLSRFAAVRRLLRSKRVVDWLRGHIGFYVRLARAKEVFRRGRPAPRVRGRAARAEA